MGRTSEISSFVLTSEEAVAKGTRRIVAITGQDAVAANEMANQLHGSIASGLASLKNNDLLEFINNSRKEVDAASISVVRKEELRNILSERRKEIEAALKSSRSSDLEGAVLAARAAIQAAPEAPFYVLELKVHGDSKSLANIAKEFSRPALLISASAEGRVTHLSAVGDEFVKKGLSAKAWSGVVASVVGGKAGGTDKAAQGSGDKADQIAAAIAAAEQFAKLNLSA